MMQAPDIATAANTDAAHTQLAIAAEIVNVTAYHQYCYYYWQQTFGGSVVILMPAWRMEIGNCGLGLLLNHSRKSGCGCGSSDWISSTCLSSWGIQLSDKWQFARNTQLPCVPQQHNTTDSLISIE